MATNLVQLLISLEDFQQLLANQFKINFQNRRYLSKQLKNEFLKLKKILVYDKVVKSVCIQYDPENTNKIQLVCILYAKNETPSKVSKVFYVLNFNINLKSNEIYLVGFETPKQLNLQDHKINGEISKSLFMPYFRNDCLEYIGIDTEDLILN